jgi:primosomal protein N' (replication factor Y)
MECPNCDVSLSYHHTQENAAELLRCHYCNHVQLQPQKCPDCGSPYFKHFGSGTQKVEQELNRLFPELKCIRFDSDTTRTKDAHRNLLTKFAKGEADILLGTQMLTKGLDLAQVTLVGVVSADGLLHFADYRARERAFQVLMQVAGRAGRGDDPGRVIIQTYTPEHPVIQAVKRHHYDSFVDVELRERSELNYPPYRSLVLLRLTGFNAGEVEETAYKLTNVLMAENSDNGLFELLGPAPAPIMRISNRYRWHILLKLSLDVPREVLNLANLREICPRSISLVIDVDPLHFG